MSTERFEQLHECLQLKWLLFSLKVNEPSSEACVKWQNLAIWVFKKARKENSMKLLKFTVQLLNWRFGLIVPTECVWLEVTTGTSLSATELTRALFELQKLLLKERYDYNVGTSTFIATELPLPNPPSFYTLNNDIFHGKKK